MLVSTKGRYALRVMVDLAEHATGEFTPLKEVAQRQEISQKYLEAVMCLLSKAALVDCAHGKGGGYRLNRAPDAYTAYEILLLTEGSLAPVACLEPNARPCSRAAECRTLSLWRQLDALIADHLRQTTLADLMRQTDGGEYVI